MMLNSRTLIICSMYYSIFLLLLINIASCKKKAPECSTCKEIVDNFHKGLSDTQKSNYGGGNTNWEENSLGSYTFSEIRLVEITEKLCDKKSQECHSMLEKYEDLVEDFWFNQFAKKTNKDFLTFFCIENIKACCPNNTYGADCSPCPGGLDNPCHGNGKCSGEGTRKGSGKCLCESSYTGALCADCKDGFFEEVRNDTHTICKVCHISCKGNCSQGGPKDCDECKDGWLTDKAHGCTDINECMEEPCEDNQYCVNTQGSYSCFTCDSACTSCTDSGPNKCNECNEGYDRLDSGKCEDKDECKQDSGLCSMEHEECFNTPGSYECICSTGYEYKDGHCIKSPKEESEEVEDEDENTEEETPDRELKEEL